MERSKSLWRDKNLHIIFSITLTAVMGVASLTPAFPAIIDAFEIKPAHIAWLITVFTVPGVVLTPVMGVIADRFGRKKVLVPSLFLFGIAGAACSLSKSYETLIVLRFFQGIGAASLGSLNVTLIGDLFHGRDRATAMGYNASVLSIGTAAYPAIGGAVALLGWYVPFFFPLLAIPVGIWVLVSLKNPEPEAREDFIRYLKNAVKSMRNQKVIGLFVLSVSTFIILYGAYLTVFPLYLKTTFDATSLYIGLMMSSMSVTTALTSSFMGKLTKHFSPVRLIVSGFILYIVSLILIPLVPKLIFILLPAMLFGMAQGLNLPSTLTLLAELSPMKYRAAFMSVNGMVLRLGQTLGPLIVGFIIANASYAWGFYFAAMLAAIMVGVILLLLRSLF